MMVTMIPVVFGAGKWIANLPTGYLVARFGRLLMIFGLLLIALIDIASIAVPRYELFLGLRGIGGLGWAMFATVATTAMVNPPSAHHRGRAVSRLLMSETAGLLFGSATGGWLFQRAGTAAPFIFEATCMLVAAIVVTLWASRATERATTSRRSNDQRLLGSVLRTPGVLLMGFTSAVLMAIQTGIVVFLLPLYLMKRGALQPEAVGLVVSLGVLGRLVALWFGGEPIGSVRPDVYADSWASCLCCVPREHGTPDASGGPRSLEFCAGRGGGIRSPHPNRSDE